MNVKCVMPRMVNNITVVILLNMSVFEKEKHPPPQPPPLHPSIVFPGVLTLGNNVELWWYDILFLYFQIVNMYMYLFSHYNVHTKLM